MMGQATSGEKISLCFGLLGTGILVIILWLLYGIITLIIPLIHNNSPIYLPGQNVSNSYMLFIFNVRTPTNLSFPFLMEHT
jgi:hypothetical protein